jgi:uncharacterized protein YggE
MSTSISGSTALMAALSLSSFLIGALPATADNLSFAHIQTLGTSELTVEPDMAEIQVEVSITKDSAKAAKEASDKAVSQFIERLLKAGIDKKHISSANINLQPQYKYEKNKEPELIGYRANRQVSVTVIKFNELNAMLDTALEQGINKINNVSLKSSKEAQVVLKARQAAIKDAQAKAASLAQGFGMQLGELWQVTYLDRRSVQPVMLQMSEKMAFDGGQGGYDFGLVTIEDSVEVIYKIK